MQLTINNFNPWWLKKSVPGNLTGRPRRVFNELRESLKLRQITLISGMRRVGKTTLIFQLIDFLIAKENIDPYNILYFSFDDTRFELNKIIEHYETKILKSSIKDQARIFLFFDEIQKYQDWPNKVKMIYDMNPNIKIILTGSTNLSLSIGSRESLAGRFFEYIINPLDYYEYLEFMNIKVDFAREDINRQILISTFNHYLECGGFIEALKLEKDYLIKYFKESILERIIFKDISETFPIRNTSLLYRLINIWAEFPGLYLNYKNLANDLKVDQRTIANFVDYTDQSLITKRIYNYSTNALTSEKKMKRIYLTNTAFTNAIRNGNINFSRLLEQYWVMQFKSRFFYRFNQKDEVDIIYIKDKIILPIEIKMKNRIKKEDFKPVLSFMKKFRLNNGFLITLQTDETYTVNRKRLTLIPYWKYYSIDNYVNTLK